MELQTNLYGETHRIVLLTTLLLIATYTGKGEYNVSVPLLRKRVAILEQQRGPHDRVLLDETFWLGQMIQTKRMMLGSLVKSKAAQESGSLMTDAYKNLRELHREGDPLTIKAAARLADHYWNINERERAETLWPMFLGILESIWERKIPSKLYTWSASLLGQFSCRADMRKRRYAAEIGSTPKNACSQTALNWFLLAPSGR